MLPLNMVSSIVRLEPSKLRAPPFKLELPPLERVEERITASVSRMTIRLASKVSLISTSEIKTWSELMALMTGAPSFPMNCDD